MSFGIVLGAGGPFGWAFHLGVIEGIREATGQDIGAADRVVGTSAGGAIAASLFAGATTEDLLDTIMQPPSAAEREEMRDTKRRLARQPLRALRPQAPSMLRLGGVVGMVGLLPRGAFPTFPLRRFPTHSLTKWPGPLWIPSVRLGDGHTVVFGRDRIDVAVSEAVEATSAVPSMFQPKTIGNDHYIDGAVASATHADLLADSGLDTVFIASPMTRPGRGFVRLRARRQLKHEVAAIQASGTRTVVVHPSDAVMAAADGFPRRNPDAGLEIVDAARQQTIDEINQLTQGSKRQSP